MGNTSLNPPGEGWLSIRSPCVTLGPESARVLYCVPEVRLTTELLRKVIVSNLDGFVGGSLGVYIDFDCRFIDLVFDGRRGVSLSRYQLRVHGLMEREGRREVIEKLLVSEIEKVLREPVEQAVVLRRFSKERGVPDELEGLVIGFSGVRRPRVYINWQTLDEVD